jgi:hypothetical protein
MVLHLWLFILLVGGDIPIDSETLLVIDFVNLKIKSVQSFGEAHRGRICVRVFVGVSARTCMSIYVCTVFLKKKTIISRNDTFKKMKECKIFFPRMGVGLWRDNEGTIEGKKYIRWVQAT